MFYESRPVVRVWHYQVDVGGKAGFGLCRIWHVPFRLNPGQVCVARSGAVSADILGLAAMFQIVGVCMSTVFVFKVWL